MSDPTGPSIRRVWLGALSRRERLFVTHVLRDETVGGVLMLAAAAVAVVWASSSFSASYHTFQQAIVGPDVLHLRLSLEEWAADGLLAVFFFVAGLELKRELVVGPLRDPAQAAVPVVAAVCGMLVPAGVYLVAAVAGGGEVAGWPVPMATDIAFALAVLAVVGSHLPPALRGFLLTLAIVDDLGAVIVIAVAFTHDVDLLSLGAAALLVLGYAGMQRTRAVPAWLWIPLALVVWLLVLNSGVHPTVAGVALGLATRARPFPGHDVSPAEHLEHQVRPASAGLAVPCFALLASGVAVSGTALHDVLTDPTTVAVILGLVAGKPIGVLGGAAVTARVSRARLSSDLAWSDIAGVALLSGIGFTVSLLMSELAFAGKPATISATTLAVLVASLLATGLALPVLRTRNRHYRHLEPADGDGVPDVYQRPAPGQTGPDATPAPRSSP